MSGNSNRQAIPVITQLFPYRTVSSDFSSVEKPSCTWSGGNSEGLPANETYFFFFALVFIAMLFDANNLKSGAVRGKHRILRHVGRMSCAQFFATSSLFTGPGSIVFPESVRGDPMLSVPQLLVLVLAIFWIYHLLLSKN